MLACSYDKSFSGLLSAVFDGFADGPFPDLLLAVDAVVPLNVTSCRLAVTDQAKADRVWAGLKKKLSGEGLEDLACVWLSEAAGADQLLFRYLRLVFTARNLIQTDYATPEVLAIARLARKVRGERHSLLGFTRFQETSQKVYFAAIAPRYNVLPLLTGHFADRFADQDWIIFDSRRQYGVHCANKVFSRVSLDPGLLVGGRLPQELLADQEQLFQELWRGYLESVTIRERINPDLQARLLPRRFWPLLTEFWEEPAGYAWE